MQSDGTIDPRELSGCLGLDCATSTGWSYGAANQYLYGGVKTFPLQRGESPGIRFVRFRRWLVDLVKTHRPKRLAVEIAHHRGGAATELCVGMTTRVQEVGAEFGIEVSCCSAQNLKWHATGNAKASKEEMEVAAEKRWAVKPQNDDHADAMLLLAWGLDDCPVRDTDEEKSAAKAAKEREKAERDASAQQAVLATLDTYGEMRAGALNERLCFGASAIKRHLVALEAAGKVAKTNTGWRLAS